MTTQVATLDMGSGLGAIGILSGLEPEVLERLGKRCRWHRYAAQEMILDRAESEIHDVYFVIEGAVRIVNYSPLGREIAFANIRQGGYFGELAAIDGAARSASVVAIQNCRLASLSPEVFRNLVFDHPEIAMKVIMQLAGIVRLCDDRIMDLSTQRAVHRVHAELLRLAKPDIVAPDNWVVRPMRPHAEIASRVSTTRETVARALSQLATAGIVERKGKTLYIRDYQRLTELAEGGAYQAVAAR